MNDEDLESLIKTNSERITELSRAGEPLSKQDRNYKHMLRLQADALQRIKAAKDKGDLHSEIKAGIDYAVYKEYERKHPLIVFLVKARTRWYGF